MPARAWGEVLLQLLGQRMGTHLEHLDVGDAEVEVGGVAEDEGRAEEDADGEE